MSSYEPGIDISNFTSRLSTPQLDYIERHRLFVTIGLQSRKKAIDFKAQLDPVVGPPLQFYTDLPKRDIAMVPAGSRVWIDVEPGCFTEMGDVRYEVGRLLDAHMQPGIYCNRFSYAAVFGNSEEFSWLPLWYADYGQPPIFEMFHGFNGWTQPRIWQYSDKGVAGINCDLNFMETYEMFKRTNDESLWYSQPEHQTFEGSRGVNALNDFPNLPSNATELEVEVEVSGGDRLLVCDGDELIGEETGTDTDAFTILGGSGHGRVKLSPDGWFHLLAPGQLTIAGVRCLGYYVG